MRKIRKITIVIVGVFFIKSIVYAKYTYVFEQQIVELKRDANIPICKVTYSSEEMTNQNVQITITSNKEIEQASGFELSEDKKKLTKWVEENGDGQITVRDLEGNSTEVEYHVENIDKEKPKLINCEDGGIYKRPFQIEYSDNSEIKDVSIQKISDQLIATIEEKKIGEEDNTNNASLTLAIQGSPKETKKYRYYLNHELIATSLQENYTFAGLEKEVTYLIRVEALDGLGEKIGETEIETKIDSSSKSSSENEEKVLKNTKNELVERRRLSNTIRRYRWKCSSFFYKNRINFQKTIEKNKNLV